MKQPLIKSMTLLAMLTVCAAPAYSGGLLTNTNQHAAFLRNPARDGAIGIDGVNSNPAGTAFLPQGFHLAFTWQMAFQKRVMNAEHALFAANENWEGKLHRYEGKSVVPFIPSFQAAYVFNDKWSASAQFAIGSGGGKCEFHQGLPMFEELVGGTILGAGGERYGLLQSLTGEQYFYGLQVGGTYRPLPNLSVFGGVRALFASCAYRGQIADITANGTPAGAYFGALASQAATAAQGLATAGRMEEATAYTAAAAQATMASALFGQPLVLDCKQSGFGLTPILGVDYKIGRWNLAAKYEFRTKVDLTNTSANSANMAAIAEAAPEVAVYADGNHVRSDVPALLGAGVQFEATKQLRVLGGFHYYWDKSARGTAIKQGDNTWEILAGVEWDVTPRLQLGIGAQRTQYGFDDSDISDLNFNACSTTLCMGGAYRFSSRVKLNLGYMHGFYNNNEFVNEVGTSCCYTRRNDVIAASVDLSF